MASSVDARELSCYKYVCDIEICCLPSHAEMHTEELASMVFLLPCGRYVAEQLVKCIQAPQNSAIYLMYLVFILSQGDVKLKPY